MAESHLSVERAVECLGRGELVAIPTETVYGLAADAANEDAIRKVFALKGRPADHPVIVHLGEAKWAWEWARDLPAVFWSLAELHWPGPLTMIVPRAAGVSDLITGGQDTVGLRVPRHPLTLELLRRFGGAVVAPSANRFGRVSPTRAEHVRSEFPSLFVLDGGPCEVGVESTIVDLSREPYRILRPGAVQLDFTRGSGKAPGNLPSHYAPSSPARLVSPAEIPKAGSDVAVLWHTTAPLSCAAAIRLPCDAEGYARGLYAALRELDRGLPLWIEEVPSGWEAVADRLRRATAGSGSRPPTP